MREQCRTQQSELARVKEDGCGDLPRYEEMKGDLEQLAMRCQQDQKEIEGLRRELAEAVRVKNALIFKVNSEYKRTKAEQLERIRDLEDELREVHEAFQRAEESFRERESELESQMTAFKTQIREAQLQASQTHGSVPSLEELRQRESIIYDLERNLSSTDRKAKDLNDQLRQAQSEFEAKESELASAVARLKAQLAQSKSAEKDKENQAAQLKDSLRKESQRRHDAELRLEELSRQAFASEENVHARTRKAETELALQRQHYESIIAELKSSIEEIVGIKSQLLGDNKRLLSLLHKKEKLEKQKRLLLKNELREIDRL